MAAYNGINVRRASVVSGTVDTITFDEPVQVVGLVLMSDGQLAYKVNDDITTISDTDSNYLDTDSNIRAVTIARDYGINKISVISNANVDIQWEIKR